MPVIQDILECFGVCSACSISFVISLVGFIHLTFFGGFYLFIYFKAELCSNNICEVLSVQRTILVEGDLSMLFVSQHLLRTGSMLNWDWVVQGFVFLHVKPTGT